MNKIGKPTPINQYEETAKIALANTKELFILLWTKAVPTSDYDKKEWKELRRMLNSQGIDV